MTAYIIRRLLLLIPVLLIVGVIVFTLIHLTPGDPASVMLGPDATNEQKEALREQLGLNEPFFVQFVNWFWDALRLDFGESLFIGEPVTTALKDRAQPTGLLTLFCRHTSASLLIQENADPDVRTDLEAWFSAAAPEDPDRYVHTVEGPDDMPAHIRTALTQTHLAIPVEGGVPLLVEGKLVGALGISGGSSAEDEACAVAGAAALR